MKLSKQQFTNGVTRRISTAPRRTVANKDLSPFSLNDTRQLGCNVRLATPTMVIGIGTTAGRATLYLGRLIAAVFGYIPAGVGYLIIDSDGPPSELDVDHFVSLGTDGAGTKPNLGRSIFRKNRRKIRDALLSHIEHLHQVDPLLAADKSAREVTTFHIVAGPGGTSGGGLDELITLIHEVSRQRGIQEVRVVVTAIGPDVCLLDTTREITPEQQEVVPDTYAQNLHKIYRDIATGSNRVFALQVVDQANGEANFPTANELTEMIGLGLFIRGFTRAGMDFNGRTRDHRGLGGFDGTPR